MTSQSSPTHLVSVIVPVYNSAGYLRTTLTSICNQTYSNLEILLIDDGSTDESLEICRNLASQDARVRVFHHDNCGASMTRNKGIEKATGEYIMFVDSDDIISSYCVEILLKTSLSSKADISIADVITQCCSPVSFPDPPKDAAAFSLVSRYQAYEQLAHYEWWGPCSKLYRSSFLKEYRFPPATLSEDYALMVQLFDKASVISYIPRPLYAYRKRENSLSTTRISPRALDEVENTELAWKYAQTHVKDFAPFALLFYTESLIKVARRQIEVDHPGALRMFKFCQKRLCRFLIRICTSTTINYKLKLHALGICGGIIIYRTINFFIQGKETCLKPQNF